MTDGQLLLAVFTAFYLAECLHWLPLQATVLSTWALRRGWSAGRPSPHVAARGRGLALAWPLPPLGSLLTTQSWPVLPDKDGLRVGPGQLQEGKRLDWQAVAPVLDQRNLKLGQGLEVQCTSRREASLLAAFLRETAALKPARRQASIEAFWQSSLSLPRARAALRKYRLATWALRLPCLTVFLAGFCWMPLLFWQFGGSSWRVLVGFASLLALTTMVAFVWRALHRRLFPDSKGRTWGEVLHLIFVPAHTMRAHDLIGVEVMAGVHPLAAAATVLKRPALKAFASSTWSFWRFRPASDPLADTAPSVLPRIEACVLKLGFTLEELQASPSKQAGALSYCPRCQAQFTLTETACEQCGGVATRTWA